MNPLVVAGNLSSNTLTTNNVTIKSSGIVTVNGILYVNTSFSFGMYFPNGGISVNQKSFFKDNVTIIGNITLYGDQINVTTANVNQMTSSSIYNGLKNPTKCEVLDAENLQSTGYDNTLQSGPTNDENTWFGINAMLQYPNLSMYNVYNNNAFGYTVLPALIQGKQNDVAGTNAMKSQSKGDFNVAVGESTLLNKTDSSYNTAVGTECMYKLSQPTANYNTAVGCVSMTYALSSFNNTCVGSFTCKQSDPRQNYYGGLTMAGFYAGFENDFQGVNNTYIGAYADSAPYGGGEGFENSTALGYRARVTNSNQIVLGTATENVNIPGFLNVGTNTSYKTFDISGNLTVQGNIRLNGNPYVPSSDARLKEQVNHLPFLLTHLDKLQPVQFTWIDSKKKDMGFLAQQFYEVMTPDMWPEDIRFVRPDGMLTLDYGKMIVILTQSIKELQQKVKQLKELQLQRISKVTSIQD